MFQKVSNWFQGRHTLFLIVSVTLGASFAWFHRLDSNLVTLLLGLQGAALTHSFKEDYFQKKTS